MLYYLTSFKVLLHFVPEIHTFGIKIIKGNQTKHNLIKHVSWIKGFVKKDHVGGYSTNIKNMWVILEWLILQWYKQYDPIDLEACFFSQHLD